MNESKILRIACDSAWYAHAYSEYLADVAENVSNLMTALQEILAFENFDVSSAIAVLEDHGINPAARFVIGEYGDVEALQLATNMWNSTESTEGYEPDYDYTIDEALSIIRDTWTQAVISSKAFESYVPKIDNQVDRVAKFIQDVQANFTIDDYVRDTVSYYQSLINSSDSIENFVKTFIKASGIDDADETNDSMAYVNSDLYKYTGNTPGIALDFSTVNKAVSSTISVAAKTVKGVFSLAKQGLSWLFNKAKKYVVDTVIDPAVCEYIDNDGQNDGFLDGFAWFGEFIPNVTYSYFPSGGQISDLFKNFYDEYAEKWIKIKLKVGEFLFRIIDNDIKWQCYFKPVAVDVEYFKNNYTGSETVPVYHWNDHDTSIQNYTEWLERVMDNIQPCSKDATKNQVCQGFVFGTMLAQSIVSYAFFETYVLVNGSTIEPPSTSLSNLRYLSDVYTFDPITPDDEVTNIKMITAAAGDPADSNNINHYIYWSDSMGVKFHETDGGVWSMRASMTNIISIWAMCRKERQMRPNSYTFVPYSNNHTGFSPSSWRVKSDEEIANTRDTFLERLIIAAVIVAAVVFIGITAKKISRKIFFKRKKALSVLENKMWSGQSLTASERRKYIRYNRRLNLSKLLNTGSNDSFSILANDNQSIISLIRN